MSQESLKRHLHRQSPIPLSDYVTLAQLAQELEIELDRLKPLIAAGYLRILDAKEAMAETVVARPLPAAMDWLQTMFMPLDLRPLLSCKQICDALDITPEDFRYLCLTDNIPIYDDPAFGELISASGFYVLQQGWLKMTSALRTDRQALMLILAMIKGKTTEEDRLQPFPYTERLEREIQRIAALPEPERTLRATDFWAAFNDANNVTECLEQIRDPEEFERNRMIRKKVRRMGERMERQGGKKLVTAPEDAQDRQSDSHPQ